MAKMAQHDIERRRHAVAVSRTLQRLAPHRLGGKVDAERGRVLRQIRGITNREILVALRRGRHDAIRSPGLDRVTFQPVDPRFSLEFGALVAGHARAPGELHPAAQALQDAPRKNLELVRIDRDGGVVEGPHRDELVEILVEAVLQRRRVIPGVVGEACRGEARLPHRDREPGRHRYGKPNGGGGEDRKEVPRKRPLGPDFGEVHLVGRQPSKRRCSRGLAAGSAAQWCLLHEHASSAPKARHHRGTTKRRPSFEPPTTCQKLIDAGLAVKEQCKLRIKARPHLGLRWQP